MPGASSWRFARAACARSEREQQQQRDQQREDPERLGDGKSEDQVTELTLRGGRVAQGGGEIMPEDRADADAGTAHADACNSGADHLCCLRVHGVSSLFERTASVAG